MPRWALPGSRPSLHLGSFWSTLGDGTLGPEHERAGSEPWKPGRACQGARLEAGGQLGSRRREGAAASSDGPWVCTSQRPGALDSSPWSSGPESDRQARILPPFSLSASISPTLSSVFLFHSVLFSLSLPLSLSSISLCFSPSLSPSLPLLTVFLTLRIFFPLSFFLFSLSVSLSCFSLFSLASCFCYFPLPLVSLFLPAPHRLNLKRTIFLESPHQVPPGASSP